MHNCSGPLGADPECTGLKGGICRALVAALISSVEWRDPQGN